MTRAGWIVAILGVTLFAAASCDGRFRPSQSASARRAPLSMPDFSDLDDGVELDVLSYNVFLRPPPVGWGDATRCRAREIGRRLAARADEYDLVVLNETFAQEAMRSMMETLGEAFPHRILRKPDASALATNGGVSVLSRHPLDAVHTEPFETCAGTMSDCRSTKGFVHAEVDVSPMADVDLLATHLDAGSRTGDHRARIGQLQTIRNYIDSLASHRRSPLLLLGDLNIDGLRRTVAPRARAGARTSEYESMMATLSPACDDCSGRRCGPECSQGPTDAVASLLGALPMTRRETRKLNSLNCSGQSLFPCESPNRGTHWRDRQRLDYVMVFDRPDADPSARVVSAEHEAFDGERCDTPYLSDHKAVASEVQLSPGETSR